MIFFFHCIANTVYWVQPIPKWYFCYLCVNWLWPVTALRPGLLPTSELNLLRLEEIDHECSSNQPVNEPIWSYCVLATTTHGITVRFLLKVKQCSCSRDVIFPSCCILLITVVCELTGVYWRWPCLTSSATMYVNDSPVLSPLLCQNLWTHVPMFSI